MGHFLSSFMGNIGEKLVCKHLKKCGFTILGKQYRVPYVEVDILAVKDEVLYVFEVKAESTALDDFDARTYRPEQRVTREKIAKLKTFAKDFLAQHPQFDGAIVQIVTVVYGGDMEEPYIQFLDV